MHCNLDESNFVRKTNYSSREKKFNHVIFFFQYKNPFVVLIPIRILTKTQLQHHLPVATSFELTLKSYQ